MSLIFKKSFDIGEFLIFDERPLDIDLLTVHQTHSDDIIFSKKALESKVSADGICLEISKIQNSALAIKTADCLPILFVSQTHVALIHAGWRGIKQKIHLNRKLQEKQFSHIFIGASISAKNFEVGIDFQEQFPNSSHFQRINDKLTFNLQKHVMEQLQECYPLAIIERSDICTYENKKFHSYRQNKTEKRNWNIFKRG